MSTSFSRILLSSPITCRVELRHNRLGTNVAQNGTYARQKRTTLDGGLGDALAPLHRIDTSMQIKFLLGVGAKL